LSVEIIGLRCSKCGAPLPKPSENSEYVRCEYCGTLQKIIEASFYTEKLKTEVLKWIREFMPASIASVQTVDALARHNIFVAYIRPKIMPEYNSLKVQVIKTLSSTLLLLKNLKVNIAGSDPKESFEKFVKVESIAPMAIVQEDQEFYNEVYSTYALNAYINNYIKTGLLGDTDSASRNLEELSNILSNIEKYAPIYLRIKSLVNALKAWKSMEMGDFASAIAFLGTSLKDNKTAKDLIIKDPQLSIMITAINTEEILIRSLLNYAEIEKVLFESGHQPQEIMIFLEKYFKIIEQIRNYFNKNLSIHYELSEKIKSIYMSKLGKETVEILPGQGDIIVPLYVIKISYTFVTGSLLWKKGKEYKDYLLVLATYPYTVIPVTDTFRMRSGFLDKMRGREEKLTIDTISNTLSAIRQDYIKIPVIPPLTDADTAKRVADEYLQAISTRLGGKISMGSSYVEKLVYGVAKIIKNDIFIDSLGETQVSIGKYLEELSKMVIR